MAPETNPMVSFTDSKHISMSEQQPRDQLNLRDPSSFEEANSSSEDVVITAGMLGLDSLSQSNKGGTELVSNFNNSEIIAALSRPAADSSETVNVQDLSSLLHD